MSQEQLFESEVTPPRVRAVAVPAVVARSPGWVLVATTSGPRGFHLVKTAGSYGSLVTVCGLTGRKVVESQREIIECAECAAPFARS